MTTILGFTGTRHGMTAWQQQQLDQLLQAHRRAAAFHHGDCLGADLQAHRAAKAVGLVLHIHPPSGTRYRAWCQGAIIDTPHPYAVRNQAIVDACMLLIAAPFAMQETRHSGTWMTVRMARLAHKPVVLLWPRSQETPDVSTLALR